MTFAGLRVIESSYAEVPGKPVMVLRTWRERLFTRPWRPLKKHRMVTPMVPAIFELRDKGIIITHPSFVPEFRKITESTRERFSYLRFGA